MSSPLNREVHAILHKAMQYGELRMKWGNDPKYVPDPRELEEEWLRAVDQYAQQVAIEARRDEWVRIKQHSSSPPIFNHGKPIKGWWQVDWEYVHDRIAELDKERKQ